MQLKQLLSCAKLLSNKCHQLAGGPRFWNMLLTHCTCHTRSYHRLSWWQIGRGSPILSCGVDYFHIHPASLSAEITEKRQWCNHLGNMCWCTTTASEMQQLTAYHMLHTHATIKGMPCCSCYANVWRASSAIPNIRWLAVNKVTTSWSSVGSPCIAWNSSISSLSCLFKCCQKWLISGYITHTVKPLLFQELECIKQIKSMLLSKCEQCSAKKKDQLADMLSGEAQVGFLLSERFINIPPQIALPSYENLWWAQLLCILSHFSNISRALSVFSCWCSSHDLITTWHSGKWGDKLHLNCQILPLSGGHFQIGMYWFPNIQSSLLLGCYCCKSSTEINLWPFNFFFLILIVRDGEVTINIFLFIIFKIFVRILGVSIKQSLALLHTVGGRGGMTLFSSPHF